MMGHHISSEEQVGSLCELDEDDGPVRQPGQRRGPRGRNQPGSGPRVRAIERKSRQLCRQVAVTLDEVLAECGDPALQGLHVANVEPFPDTSRLLVTVLPVDGQLGVIAPSAVLKHLEPHSGYLRYEVAAAVTRKRAPSLFFRLAEPSGPEIDWARR